MPAATPLFTPAPNQPAPICRIPSLVSTGNGVLLAFCEARTSLNDWSGADILQRRSTDGGSLWDKPRPLNPPDLLVQRNPLVLKAQLAHPDQHTFHNPLALAGCQPGEVHLLFCAEYARCYHIHSRDDGVTWSPPTDITSVFEPLRQYMDWRVLATGPGHGIRLSRGPFANRLIAPVWISEGSSAGGHRPSLVSTIYSDDGGMCWHIGSVVAENCPRIPNPSEACLTELPGGEVLLNLRTESPINRRFISRSPDVAAGWSAPQPHPALFDPVCHASLLRLSWAPSRLIFSNPDSRARAPHNPPWGSRANLTVRLSLDDGLSWPHQRVIDAGFSGYSDLAMLPDGTICCIWEAGSPDGGIFFTRFSLDWLESSNPLSP